MMNSQTLKTAGDLEFTGAGTSYIKSGLGKEIYLLTGTIDSGAW